MTPHYRNPGCRLLGHHRHPTPQSQAHQHSRHKGSHSCHPQEALVLILYNILPWLVGF